MKRTHAFLAAVLILGLIVITSCEVSTTETDQESSPEELGFETTQAVTSGMFSGQEEHWISSSTANEMIAHYAQQSAGEPNGWYFGRDAVVALLAQNSVVGMRIYHALKNDGGYSPVIFAVTQDGRNFDADHRLAKSLSDSTIIILDLTMPCPPYCGEGE